MISSMIARAKLRQIFALMEQERSALLFGPLESLPDISAKRSVVLEALSQGGPVAQTLLGKAVADIRDLAMRNKKLFESSIAGMKSAMTQLDELENDAGSMQTYTSKGEKVFVLRKKGSKDLRI